MTMMLVTQIYDFIVLSPKGKTSIIIIYKML